MTEFIVRNNHAALGSKLRSVWEAVVAGSWVNYLPAGREGK